MSEDKDLLIMVSGMAHLAFPDEVEKIITSLRSLEKQLREMMIKSKIEPDNSEQLTMVIAKSLAFAAVHSNIGQK